MSFAAADLAILRDAALVEIMQRFPGLARARCGRRADRSIW